MLHTSKKTRPDHIANQPLKIRLACRFQNTSTSTSSLVPIAPRPVVQSMQLSDKDSTLSRVDDKIAHNEERQESTHVTRNLPEFLKPKAVDKASVDRKQGVDILSTSGQHKNTLSYKLPSFLYGNKKKRNLLIHKCTQNSNNNLLRYFHHNTWHYLFKLKKIKCKIYTIPGYCKRIDK